MMKLLVVILALFADFYAVHAVVKVTGDLAEEKDDAESRAVCPSGHVIKTCSCGCESRCDGAIFEDDQTCLIHMSHDKTATKAVAECIAESCGDDWKTVQSPYSVRPSVNCPDGFEMTDCNIFSPWKHEANLVNVFTTKSQVQSGGKTVWKCQSDADCPGGRCMVEARCHKESA
ncbi:uncharacterized protein LOC141898098 [Tubulanus polymorphus]|uniref:uncharacterized protein LOC141898098 n=1 Tax=Tubulanus polymorphus TaxID=672921 RepID=UPI003DA675C2